MVFDESSGPVIRDLGIPELGLPTLRVTSRGPVVRIMQILLDNKLDMSIEADGLFGSQTRDAVRQFQQNSKLGVDGIVGDTTWATLTQP